MLSQVVAWVIVLALVIWAGQYFFALLWIPVKTVQVHSRLKHNRCPECKASFVKHWEVPTDETYGSRAIRSECANGHVYTSGNRRFADWAGF